MELVRALCKENLGESFYKGKEYTFCSGGWKDEIITYDEEDMVHVLNSESDFFHRYFENLNPGNNVHPLFKKRLTDMYEDFYFFTDDDGSLTKIPDETLARLDEYYKNLGVLN